MVFSKPRILDSSRSQATVITNHSCKPPYYKVISRQYLSTNGVFVFWTGLLVTEWRHSASLWRAAFCNYLMFLFSVQQRLHLPLLASVTFSSSSQITNPLFDIISDSHGQPASLMLHRLDNLGVNYANLQFTCFIIASHALTSGSALAKRDCQ